MECSVLRQGWKSLALSADYTRKVAELTESLNDAEIRQEAADVLSGLIDKVVLTPREDGGMDLMLHGYLARILALCEAGSGKSKPSRPGAAEGRFLAGCGGP